MPDAARNAGPRRWQEGVEPDLRRRVLEKILGKLAQVYEGMPPPSHDLDRIATSFEQKMFSEAESKDDYIKKIAVKLLLMERNRQPVLQNASGLNQHVKMGCQMQPANSIQAIRGGNSSTTTMSQVSPMMSIHERQSPHMRSQPITPSGSSPVPKQHMTYPIAPKLNIKNGQMDAATMSDHILKSSPAIVTPSSSRVHSNQLRMQSGEGQNQNRTPVMQMQPRNLNFSSGKTTSVTQSQGQQVVQPNGQQNPLSQNARGTCMLPQQQMRMNQHSLEVNQHKMNRQNSQMLVAQQVNDAKMQTGHPRDQNNQQNAGLNVESASQMYKHIKIEPQLLVTDNQECSLQNVIPQTVASMESVEEMDWREDMFQQMKDLKDAYLSELVELDQVSAVPKMTKEEFESLPKDKAEQYRFRVYMKKRIRTMLNFLQFQKSDIPEHLRGQLPMFVKAIHNVLGFYRRKKDQRAEMDTGLQSHISHKKPQIINLTDDPAPSSGYTRSTSPSPVAMAGIVKVSSSPASVSTLPSPIKKVGVAQAASPYYHPKSARSSLGTNSEVVLVASPCASMKSTSSENIETVSALLQQNNAAAAATSNGSATDLLMPSSVIQVETTDLQAEDLQHGRAETPVAKKPIDRLIDATVSFYTYVQHWTFSEQAGSSPPNNIKRIFEITSLGPESPPLVDTWEVEANVERGLKRQKTQNGRNALLDEIESANRMLMDTITSIADDNRTDGVTSSSGGTLIKLSYTAMSLSADLKSLFDTSEMPIIMPTKLLVPTDYPRSSPVLVTDQRGEQLRNMFSDISSSADVAFRNTLKRIPEPRSIGDTVWAWDTCVRRAVTEFAQRFGGGMFSSTYGRWESSGGA
ncbi:hypothetical protein PR202_ga30262 [Eleusine coracana subsp. coracana]|uniref:Mediator complex subunit 15 KIX domain-containing protein n=1 Tax=Eleusine coracana subsp. coracana TaxID=191504 RepID=A0AAV5DNU1_ELECO|nr:hypothetical protein PR202_ga30262 [Eleusine coracana subsp. coracana]